MRPSKIVAVLAGVLVAAGGAAAAAGTAPTAPTAAAAGTSVVRLVTGDSVSLRTLDGHTSVAVRTLARSGPAASWSSLRINGDLYVLPTVAKYYAGSVLDPSIFDVSAARPGASVPLDLTFAAGTHPSVPGFTTTSSTSTSMQGYVTPTGTRTFGTALLAQWRHDVQAGRTAPTSLFGVTRIVRSGAAAPVQPDFKQLTVVLKATAADGTLVPFGFVGLINTDDGRKYTGFLVISNGEARASVPVGNYSLIAETDSFDETTFAVSTSIVTLPDFSVTRNMQRVPIDFATATVTPSIRTPRPAALSTLSLEWLRTVPNGGLGFSSAFGAGDSVKIAPAPAPVHGQVDWATAWSLTGTPPDGLPYRYDAAYLDEGAIPADQSHTVATADLAQINADYYTDGGPRSALFGRTPFYPFDDFVFTELLPMPAPTARTEYLEAPASASWLDSYISHATDNDPFNGFVTDEPRVYPPGSTQSIDWLRGPLAPGMPQPANGTRFFFCPACRSANAVSVFFAPIVDTTPGHVGYLDAPDADTTVATFSLYRNGKLLEKDVNRTGALVKVPAGAAAYKAVEETFAGLTGVQRSTHAVTELTFHSDGGQGGALPDGWICAVRDTCTVLPVLTARVPLPTDLTGTMALGTNTFTVTIAPTAGAPAATVPAAHLSISTDGGTTYRAVPVTALGNNRFRATITHPAADAGKSVGLRVSGNDTTGDAITETVDDAYVVANS